MSILWQLQKQRPITFVVGSCGNLLEKEKKSWWCLLDFDIWWWSRELVYGKGSDVVRGAWWVCVRWSKALAACCAFRIRVSRRSCRVICLIAPFLFVREYSLFMRLCSTLPWRFCLSHWIKTSQLKNVPSAWNMNQWVQTWWQWRHSLRGNDFCKWIYWMIQPLAVALMLKTEWWTSLWLVFEPDVGPVPQLPLEVHMFWIESMLHIWTGAAVSPGLW